MKTAPGPKGKFLIGNLAERKKDRLGFLLRAALDYGPVTRIKFGPRLLHLVSHPDHIKHVLLDPDKNYIKGANYDSLKPLLGNGLLTSEGDFWKKQRKLAQPAFHMQRLSALTTVMVTKTQGMLNRWESAAGLPRKQPTSQVGMRREMTHLTLQIVSKALLDTDVSESADEVGDALTRVLRVTEERKNAFFPLPLSLPLPSHRRYKKDIDALNRVVYKIIAEKKLEAKSPGLGRADLLSMLIEVKDEDTGEGMSDQQLRDEVMTFFLAGHDTTANALAWSLYLLSLHPDVTRKLQTEVDEVLGGRAPTFSDLPRLSYTYRVIQESMRLYPPIWAVTREAVKDDEIGGYHIPAKSMIALSPYLMHRHPDHWESPEAFDPERFAEGAEAPNRYVYFPFGGGQRVCIGNHFAMMEAQVILAMIVRRFRFSLVPGQNVVPEPFITLKPSGELNMTLQKRS